MSAFYPSLTLGVKLRDIKAYPRKKQYMHMASMNYFLNNYYVIRMRKKQKCYFNYRYIDES